MCNIDDTLLWLSGYEQTSHLDPARLETSHLNGRAIGPMQTKKCHNWDALRDWAEDRSASYFDVEPRRGIRHFNNYHGGDGLPVGSL